MTSLLSTLSRIACLLLVGWHLEGAVPYDRLFVPLEKAPPPSSIGGIDAVYVINLDSRPEKWHRIEPLLAYHGISAVRYPAVAGIDFDIHTLRTFCTKHITGGQLGCMLSHLSIYRDALDRGFKTVWVLEDDTEIRRNPHLITERIAELSEIDPEWDILYTDLDWVRKDGSFIFSAALPIDKESPYPLSYFTYRKRVSEEITLLRARYGTGSMIMSERGMKKLLNYFLTADDIMWPYDIELHFTRGLKQYGLSNPIATNAHFSFNFSDTGANSVRNWYEIDESHAAYMTERNAFYKDIRNNWLDFMCDIKTN